MAKTLIVDDQPSIRELLSEELICEGYGIASANVSTQFLPRLCNQCEDAPCLNLCPTGATYRTHEDAVVHVNREICVGCRICVVACPYGSRFVNPLTNTADKSDLCYHRITRGLEPACVDASTGRARIFGDLNDPKSRISRYLEGRPTQRLRADLDTRPKVHCVNADESIMGPDYYRLLGRRTQRMSPCSISTGLNMGRLWAT